MTMAANCSKGRGARVRLEAAALIYKLGTRERLADKRAASPALRAGSRGQRSINILED